MNITKPMKTIISITSLCAVMAFGSIASVNASANDMSLKSDMFHQKSKKMMKRMMKKLSLSEQQQEQIKTIKEQAKEQHEVLQASIKQFKEAEKVLVQAENFDEQAYIALHTESQQTFLDLALARAKTKNAIFNVLTTEQQEKWSNLKEKRKEKSKHKGYRN